jgi:exodeoxyribonuclease VII small subunit
MATKKKQAEPGSIEESLKRLEDIAAQLQSGELPLEQSLVLYEEGLKLTKDCAGKLQKASMTVKRLEKDLQLTTTKLEDDLGEDDD